MCRHTAGSDGRAELAARVRELEAQLQAANASFAADKAAMEASTRDATNRAHELQTRLDDKDAVGQPGAFISAYYIFIIDDC